MGVCASKKSRSQSKKNCKQPVLHIRQKSDVHLHSLPNACRRACFVAAKRSGGTVVAWQRENGRNCGLARFASVIFRSQILGDALRHQLVPLD